MREFDDNQQPDDDHNLPDGVFPDRPPNTHGGSYSGDEEFLEGLPEALKNALDGLVNKIGAAGGIAIPIGSMPKGLRDKLCAMCPRMVEEEVADLDANETDEWNSIKVETDRLLNEADKIHKALDRIDTRKAVLCGSLELKHNVSGERLKIDGGKLIRKHCDKPQDDKCNLND